MANGVKFDYKKTMAQAQELDNMAEDLTGRTKQKITTAKDNIKAAWTGNTGKSFANFLEETEKDLDAKAKYLREVAAYLRKAADAMEQAENAAKNSASRIS